MKLDGLVGYKSKQNKMKGNKKMKTPANEFRKPMDITECYSYWSISLQTQVYYPLCPRCKAATKADYQKYCSNCGQRLRWTDKKLKIK